MRLKQSVLFRFYFTMCDGLNTNGTEQPCDSTRTLNSCFFDGRLAPLISLSGRGGADTARLTRNCVLNNTTKLPLLSQLLHTELHWLDDYKLGIIMLGVFVTKNVRSYELQKFCE